MENNLRNRIRKAFYIASIGLVCMGIFTPYLNALPIFSGASEKVVSQAYADENFYPQPFSIKSQDPKEINLPQACASGHGDVAPDLRPRSTCFDLDDDKNLNGGDYVCAKDFDEWLQNPGMNFWVEDPDVTRLGKAGERSRGFLYWVLTHPSIDDHVTILELWQLSENIALFFILLVAIILGIGIIVGQRANFSMKVSIVPLIIRIAILLLFVVFSARIVLLIIELADVIMEFFIRQLNVRDLFNIYFIEPDPSIPGGTNVINASERGYREFIGCTNISTDNWEMVSTSKFLINFTNMTYYFIGIMLILRKVVLWFLLIVSPFLAILAPFVFIRNIGWIWVGVFFQWIFYGPLFALFIGSLSKIWGSVTHIPFVFDFSRVDQFKEVVYPTSINILYGGPAQQLGLINTSNYIDTFAEYVISLIMLWTALLLPWWLLRIFRDYCCDGIYAMKNILLSMYDTMRTQPPGGGPSPKPRPTDTGTAGLALKLPKSTDMKANIDAEVKLSTVQDIKQAQTQDIIRSINVEASNIKQIAALETNQNEAEKTRKNLDEVAHPFRAESATERQRLMNLRDEVRERATKGDRMAQNLASATSQSSQTQRQAKQRILSSMPKMVPVIQNISVTYKMPREQTRSIVSNVFNNVASDISLVQQISDESKVPAAQTKQVLQAVAQGPTLDMPTKDIVTKVSNETGVKEEEVKKIISQTRLVVKTRPEVTQKVADQEEVDSEVVKNIANDHMEASEEPEKNIEQSVPQSQKVSIEDYEEVKKMWLEQYETGEVPVTENIQSRDVWVQQDIAKISNILNKVMSSDPKMQEQGLDEVGFILPIFMINNLSGEELLVYLKAKMEAAKQVERDIQKEEELRQKIEAEDKENLVEVDRTVKKEQQASKTKTLKRELNIDEQQKQEVEQNERLTDVRESTGEVLPEKRQEALEEAQQAAAQEEADESVPHDESEDDDETNNNSGGSMGGASGPTEGPSGSTGEQGGGESMSGVANDSGVSSQSSGSPQTPIGDELNDVTNKLQLLSDDSDESDDEENTKKLTYFDPF